MIDCFTKHDMRLGADYWVGEEGGWTTVTNHLSRDESFAIEGTCGFDTGYETLRQVYMNAIANPDAIDLEPYRVQCYKDLGVLDPKVTYEQFEGSQEIRKTMPNTSKDPRFKDFENCTVDPLHHMKTKKPAK